VLLAATHMPSDARYVYHHPQGITSPYEYAGYPPPYENTQIPQQLPLRPMRPTSSHSPNPHPQFSPSTQPHSSYHHPSAYTSTTYVTQHAPQWNGDNWTQYNQSFPPPPPPPPIPQVPFNSGPGRPEAVASVLADQRAYPSPQPIPEPRHNDERHVVPPAPGPISQTKTRRKNRESPSTGGLPGTPPGMDFMKVITGSCFYVSNADALVIQLLDSYRLIIDSSEALSSSTLLAQRRPPPADTMERMLQSAIYGAQMLESVHVQQSAPPQDTRPPAERDVEDTWEANGSASSSKRQVGTNHDPTTLSFSDFYH
jgi:hypothetical protein